MYYGECTVGHVYTVDMCLNTSTIFINFEAIYLKILPLVSCWGFFVCTVLAGLYEMAKTTDWPAASGVRAIKHFSSTSAACRRKSVLSSMYSSETIIFQKFKGGTSLGLTVTAEISQVPLSNLSYSREVTGKSNYTNQNLPMQMTNAFIRNQL